MEVMENSFLNWSEKISSDSNAVNLLGITSQHLRIQRHFTPAITSMTNRIRYYTLLAYYWEYLKEEISSKDYEKIFILTCLAHHDGENKNPELKYVFNNTKFVKTWENKDNFELSSFDINGYASNYYKRQLEILRCAWTDELRIPKFSPLNKMLADSMGDFPISFFKKKNFSKIELKEMGDKGFCICSLKNNSDEIDIMSKLFFGFFSKIDNEWVIDIEEYDKFKNGHLNISFEVNNEFYSDVENIRELNLRRRNTLFLFLKIIEKVKPNEKRDFDFRRCIWDAIYFAQNRYDHSPIDFKGLEKIRQYWEFFQLNIYFVYAMEKFLDIVQKIVALNSGIEKTKVLSILDENKFYNELEDLLEVKFNSDSLISNLIKVINNINHSNKTSLDSKINESFIFDNLYNATSIESKLANILVILLLLYKRSELIEHQIKNYNYHDQDDRLESLSMKAIFNFIKNNDEEINIMGFLKDLCRNIINKHLYEVARRLSIGTKNWIFLEEDNRLYFERKSYVGFGPQDNRWLRIRNLLKDLQFIEFSENEVNLTDKGEIWLRRIE